MSIRLLVLTKAKQPSMLLLRWRVNVAGNTGRN